eukprot:TRINITY_DN599_c0_g3_i2.p1 TRINITY_DN599_c0_g3~~TRINITY_DN599_c0_g3_i2.p1  ORF type:complete len:837 (-),score=212.09 TRINITY_DN599_c0_g3_i2:5276-7786(-)
MAAGWLYSRGGASFGPVSEEKLLRLAAQGKVLPTDLVWRDGMGAWVPLAKVPELNTAKPESMPFVSALIGLLVLCGLAISGVYALRTVASNIPDEPSITREQQHFDEVNAEPFDPDEPGQRFNPEEAIEAIVQKLRTEISDSGWWTVRPTDQVIDQLRDAIVRLEDDKALWIDDSGQFAMALASVEDIPKELRNLQAAPKKYLWISVPGIQAGMEKEAILVLRNAVKSAEMEMNAKAEPEPEPKSEPAPNQVARNKQPVENSFRGWKKYTAADLQGSQGRGVVESQFDDHPKNGGTAVYQVEGSDFIHISEDVKWSALSFEIRLSKVIPTIRFSVNGRRLDVGRMIRRNDWTSVQIVQVPDDKRIVCLLDGKIASETRLVNADSFVNLRVASDDDVEAKIELRKFSVCSAETPPADLIMIANANRPANKVPAANEPQPEPPAGPPVAAPEIPKPEVPAQEPAEEIPFPFRDYFEREGRKRQRSIADLKRRLESIEIDMRSAPEGRDKGRFRSEYNGVKDQIAALERNKVYPAMPTNPVVGDIGSFRAARVLAVLDDDSALIDVGGYDFYFRLTDYNTKKLVVDQVIDPSTCWQVSALGPLPKKVRIRMVGPDLDVDWACSLKLVKKEDLDRYRALYLETKPPTRAEKKKAVAAVLALTDDFRDYFARAAENQKTLIKATEAKVAELQAAIDSVDTLPVDKAAFRQQLILVRAKLEALKKDKPTAPMSTKPRVGELGDLKSATVVAKYNDSSVVVSIPGGPAFRLTGVDSNSLKMRPKVTIDESEVWQVIALNEKPDDAVANLIKTDNLTVVKQIKKQDLDDIRTAYEAEQKDADAP